MHSFDCKFQELAKNRFPLNLIWFGHESCNFHVEGVGNRKCGNGIFELEGETCCRSLSGPRFQSHVDRKSRYVAEGKKIMNQKQKSGIQWRRRAAVGYGKREIDEFLDTDSGIEDGFLGNRDVPNGTDFSERISHRFELDGSNGKGKGINWDQLSVENFTCDVEDSAGNDANVILVLEQALEEEKATHAALFQELEKERAAAATAVDEVMAMILRLQEDKASIEMEARQYQRVIEEKCAYDEEKMNILKEILVRREREIHFLEKEIEAYEQMNFMGNDQLEGDSSFKIDKKEQTPSFSIDSNENPVPVLQQIENSKSIGEKEVATNPKWPSNHEHIHTLALGKEMMSKHMELTSDFSASEGLVQKTLSVAGKEKTERDIRVISPGMKAPQTCGSSGEELEKEWNQAGCNMHSSMLDTESTVYDIHVIDEKTVHGKENGGKESGPLSATTSDSGVQNSIFFRDCPTISMAEIEPKLHGNSSNKCRNSLFLGSSLYKTLTIDLRMHSSSAVDGERLKIDNEVEWLRERLRIVQEEKEKLTFSTEHRERVNALLSLVEDIVNQLREIQLLREPVWQAS
ncbi:uncharacterized protein LOC110663222 isoform X2 [Hevea brasiliensis]|uniref:uncharacterized protein LOC110663222 isoform X2 n=1 Tax=Hevea brasiliensis TaxID=3981 RepID=UPI0025CC69B0|nr:uncharacterized protein LOC110663222 isoform X2 [Hevea brasiliensis]